MSKVKFTTMIEQDIVKKAKIEAIELGTSVGEFIERLIKDYLDKKEE